MARLAFATFGQTSSSAPGTDYRSGTCNIGSAEIARRRRAGHLALGASLVLLAILVAVGAPPLARVLVALPVAAAAIGYLQAWLHFCAGFAFRGVFNFGPVGHTEQVSDPAALARDRATATRIAVASLAIGLATGAVLAILPL